MQHDSLIQKKEDFEMQTRFGTFRLRAYLQTTNKQVHIALTKGSWNKGDSVLTRINSKQVNNDILETLTHNTDSRLEKMFEAINLEGKGAIVFINQEIPPIELLTRIGELKTLQENGQMKAPSIKMDTKDFGIGAQILHDIDISKIKLLSNSEKSKVEFLTKTSSKIETALENSTYVIPSILILLSSSLCIKCFLLNMYAYLIFFAIFSSSCGVKN
jgi:3,4-dihydroxy 2-butanone 4-phosphate synthase/GTP cyclohydrolase II